MNIINQGIQEYIDQRQMAQDIEDAANIAFYQSDDCFEDADDRAHWIRIIEAFKPFNI